MGDSIEVMRRVGTALMYYEGSHGHWRWKGGIEINGSVYTLNKEGNGRRKLGPSPGKMPRSVSVHTASQMYFLNLHPLEKCYDKSNHPSVNEIDVLLRVEHMEDGMAELRERYPQLMHDVPKQVESKNVKQGEVETEEVVMPCSLAWAIYDYYIQDFVCLGYELPEECLKEECKPS